MNKVKIPFERFSQESRVVFFTGAGISAESGISTFRDVEGYWSKYDPMTLASQEGFRQNPELVLTWYADRRKSALTALPNPGHLIITQFQKLFPQLVVITQNVDGLHGRAGNAPVLELHGSIHRQKCSLCDTVRDKQKIIKRTLEYCKCGGMMRPDVVWFGESLPLSLLSQAFRAAENCVLFFSIGTSTQVYPAAQLPYRAQEKGAFVLEINPEPTPFTQYADISFSGLAGTVLPKLYKEFDVTLR